VLKRTFPYLVDQAESTSSGYISKLEFKIIKEEVPFVVGGVIEILPVAVDHFCVKCLGFVIPEFNLIYISDVSNVPEEKRQLIKQEMEKRKEGKWVLVVDTLKKEKVNKAHFNLPEALQEISKIGPSKSYLIGLSHDFDHDIDNLELKKLKDRGLDVELTYDGMKFAC